MGKVDCSIENGIATVVFTNPPKGFFTADMVDQFGGEEDPAPVLEIVESGVVTMERLDVSIRRILRDVDVIAMVGASTNWNRPSYFAMKYLQEKGYRVIPVNLLDTELEKL